MQIHTLDLHFLELDHAIAVFVVEGPSGRVLIETGPYSTWPQLQHALAERGWSTADFQAVFLTHIHFDHAGAAWAFAQQGVPVYVHPKGLPHLAAPERLYNSARQIYGEHMDRLWGAMQPIDERLLHAPEHGAVIEVAGLRLTAWHTPGHANHHIAWQVEEPGSAESAVFTGDVAGVRIDDGPVVPPCPPPDIDIEAWQHSLQLLRELPSQPLYLTHFGRVSEKARHLADLETILLDWAAWMRPHAERGAVAESLVPAFQAFVRGQLTAKGVTDPATLERYEAANPAFMSVAGLLRYWNKKFKEATP